MQSVEIPPWEDFYHTGPGTLAGRYLRMFWQPVSRAKDLRPGRAVPIRIMSEDFTLYRGNHPHPNPPPSRGRGPDAPSPLAGEGGGGGYFPPHLVAFRCAHRGTQLNVGWVEGDCIRCRYHGWMYDGSGQCVEQPGESSESRVSSSESGDGTPPGTRNAEPGTRNRVRLRAYPTEEYLGLIFAYLGEGDPPPLRRFPDFDLPGVLETDPPERWPCNFWNRLDNDPAHVPFTHRNSIIRMNDLGQLAVRDATHYGETDWGLSNTSGNPNHPAGQNHFLMPNINQLRVRSKTPGYTDRRWWEYRLIFHVPIDDENSVAYDVNLTPLPEEEIERYRAARRAVQENDDPYPYWAAEEILAGHMRIEDVDPELSFYKQFWIEDYCTQVGQGRIADRSDERLGRNDLRVVLKRGLWQRELRAAAEGRPLKEWTTPPLYSHLNDNGLRFEG